MAKKRPTLDAFLNTQNSTEGEFNSAGEKTAGEKNAAPQNPSSAPEKTRKPEVVRHMLYLPLPVYDQIQEIVFTEQRGQTKRRKTHDYLLDAIDLLFKKKGLKSIAELTKDLQP